MGVNLGGNLAGYPPVGRAKPNQVGGMFAQQRQQNQLGVGPPWVRPQNLVNGLPGQPRRGGNGAPGAARQFDPRNPRAGLPPRHQPPFNVRGPRQLVTPPLRGRAAAVALLNEVGLEAGMRENELVRHYEEQARMFVNVVQVASAGLIPQGGWLNLFRKK
ncbi:MAG: hypothetical protein JWQ11_2389 [Rhizobacter sp.]|nr:hypothetical protein [Rhizobacter sp.]